MPFTMRGCMGERADWRAGWSDPAPDHEDPSPGPMASLPGTPISMIIGQAGGRRMVKGKRPSRPRSRYPRLVLSLRTGRCHWNRSNHSGSVRGASKVRYVFVRSAARTIGELGGVGASGDELLELRGEVTYVEDFVVAEQHRSFDGVPKLANVARPGMRLQRVDGAG